MRYRTAWTLMVAFALIPVAAAAADEMPAMKDMDMKNMDSMHRKGEADQKHSASGVVVKADPQANQVTLRHGPVKSLHWPAMTMAFAVKEKSLWDKLKVGKTVQFEFVQEGSDFVVTSVK